MPRISTEKPGLALAPRIFAVMAAVLLVGSVALGAMLPTDMTLMQALQAMNEAAGSGLQHHVVGLLGKGVWESVIVPVLIRPVWMIPVCLGVICIGAAVSANFQASPHTKRRRS